MLTDWSNPPAVKIKKTLRNQTVTETQDAVFTLELTHADVKGSQWIKNGVELQSSDKYEISSDGMIQTLKIRNCNTQDESVYSFKLGKLSANARLNVESQYRSHFPSINVHACRVCWNYCRTTSKLFNKRFVWQI